MMVQFDFVHHDGSEAFYEIEVEGIHPAEPQTRDDPGSPMEFSLPATVTRTADCSCCSRVVVSFEQFVSDYALSVGISTESAMTVIRDEVESLIGDQIEALHDAAEEARIEDRW